MKVVNMFTLKTKVQSLSKYISMYQFNDLIRSDGEVQSLPEGADSGIR